MGERTGLKFSLGPFDSARFEALAEGLEISVVALSVVRDDNPTTRIDSTYFSRAGLEVDRVLRARPHTTIADASASVLSFGAYALTNQVEYQEEGIPFLRCADIKHGFVSFGDTLHIDAGAHELLHKSQIAPETVLLTMSGSVGEAAVALPEWPYPINSNQDIAKIRTLGIDPYYLAAFLGSHYGEAQLERLPVGSVQQHVFLSMIERLLVARFGTELEASIGRLLRRAYLLRAEAGEKIAQAEATLLDALGLCNWSPPEPLTYTQSAAAVASAERLDAQYFMPAKTQMLAALAALPGGIIDDCFASIRDMVDPTRGDRTRLVRNYDLTDALQPVLDTSISPVQLVELDSQKKRMQNGDLAVARLRSYLREIAVVRVTDDVPVVGSSEFFVLRHRPEARSISAEAMMIYLRARPVQTVLKWCQDGSQHPRFAERDLMAIPLPDVVADLNDELTQQVCSGLEQRASSTAFLTAAKRAVEIAIEESEERALSFLAEFNLDQTQ